MDFASLAPLLDRPLFALGSHLVSVGELLLLLLAFAFSWRLLRRRHRGGYEGEGLDAVLRAQAELSGRVQSMGELLAQRQGEVGRTLHRQLADQAERSGETLARLQERLALIDRAQGDIRSLAGEMVRLQDILADKQARGAFGQARMEAIVRDALPPGGYAFQATLSNGKRPDCVIPMPNGAPALVVDAKFPLESWTAFREAPDEGTRQSAASRLRRDMDVHVRAISEKYLLPGETQDTAFLFVPSESIFADLGEHFPDVLQRARRARVVVVSPTLLMLSIEVVRALLKDGRMREEAGRIQREVMLLAEDMARLQARAEALRTHFGQAGRDVDQILVSTAKLMRRAGRISEIEMQSDDEADAR
jgi:DNA recombination protein RmuC